MAWRLNKGDWSEAYVFLKLLAEGRIYSGDEDLNKVLSVYGCFKNYKKEFRCKK